MLTEAKWQTYTTGKYPLQGAFNRIPRKLLGSRKDRVMTRWIKE
ncbi:hypothetical protein HMPREF1861_01609 [Corynebacterium kroppenstedtii]|nr:hypothetical protein HMPREF1861_01609 [Corynebacterium kroppenstedtii]